MARNKKNPEPPHYTNIKEEGPTKKLTYKECLTKGLDPLDSEYIDLMINEKFAEVSTQWKKDVKEENFKELKQELNEKLEALKKAYHEHFEIDFSDDDTMDISGHGQLYEQLLYINT